MNKQVLFIISFAITMISCNGTSSGESNEVAYSRSIDSQLDEVHENMDMLELYVKQYRMNKSEENLMQVLETIESLHFEYNEEGLSQEQREQLFTEKLRVDSVRIATAEALARDMRLLSIPQVSLSDHLAEGIERHSFYASKGDTVNVDVTFATKGTVTLYNANSKQTIKSFVKKNNISDKIPITNSAVYLVEINPGETQYIDAGIGLQKQSIEDILHPKRIEEETVPANKNDWKTTRVDGVQMTSLFEEPRKFTLRGQLKAAFSGSSRALVALQVPRGATDVLYSLRISTNEGSCGTDGQFADGMASSYHKVRFLGLPLYESQRGSGLIATLLGENQPPREEDAYINMYVFFDSGQARKFQDGELTSKLKYHVDYSTMGTQSCNGRIPAKGNSTIYLGFENERMRYNNYVWLEAISAVPSTEYFKTQYTIK